MRARNRVRYVLRHILITAFYPCYARNLKDMRDVACSTRYENFVCYVVTVCLIAVPCLVASLCLLAILELGISWSKSLLELVH